MPLTIQEKIETKSNNLKFDYYLENVDKKRKKITLDGIVYMFGEIVPNIKSCVLYYSKLAGGLNTFELKYPELYEFYKLLANQIDFEEREEEITVHTPKYFVELERKMLNTLVRKSHALMAFFKNQGDNFKIPSVNDKEYFEYKNERYAMSTLKKHLKQIINHSLINKISSEMTKEEATYFREIIQKAELKLNTPNVDSTIYQIKLLRDLARIDDLETVEKGSDLSILIDKMLVDNVGPNLRKQAGAKIYDLQLDKLQKHHLANA